MRNHAETLADFQKLLQHNGIRLEWLPEITIS
jgi:hypothetical protein